MCPACLATAQSYSVISLASTVSVLVLASSPRSAKAPRFGGAKFVRNHGRSGLNHVLGRRYCCVGTFAQVHNFEHGEGMFGDLLIVRISSDGSDSLRAVDNVVTGLFRYSNR